MVWKNRFWFWDSRDEKSLCGWDDFFFVKIFIPCWYSCFLYRIIFRHHIQIQFLSLVYINKKLCNFHCVLLWWIQYVKIETEYSVECIGPNEWNISILIISNNRLLEPKNELMGRFQTYAPQPHVLVRRSDFGAAILATWLVYLSYIRLCFSRVISRLRFYCLLSSEHLIFVLLFFFIICFELNRNFPMTKTDTFTLRSVAFF